MWDDLRYRIKDRLKKKEPTDFALRRTLKRAAVAGLAGVFAAPPVVDFLLESIFFSSNTEQLAGVDLVTPIEKPEGKYTIMFGFHTTPQKIGKLPSDTTAVFLETPVNCKYMADPVNAVNSMRELIQYSELFKMLEERELPLFLADASPLGLYTPLGVAEMSVIGAESAAGLIVAHDLAYCKKPESLKKLSRRGFLKGGAAALASAWMISPSVTGLTAVASGKTGIGEEYSSIGERASHNIHPEVSPLTLHVRNVIMAHKQERLMNTLNENGKHHYVTAIGRIHTNIVDRINESPNSRLTFLNFYSYLARHYYVPETVYGIKSLRFKSNEWKVDQTFEVPELKSLVL